MAKKNRAISTSRKVYLDTAHAVRFLIRATIALFTLGWAAFSAYFGIDCLAWPVTNGQMISTTITGNGGGLVYRYSVNQQIYESARVRFGDILWLNSEQEFLSTYKPGSVAVRYNPDLPSMSALLTGYERLGVYIPLGIGAFFFVTAGVELRSRYLRR